MYPEQVVLSDGEVLLAMLYPRELIEKQGDPDISHHGGWAAYKLATTPVTV